MQLPAWRAPPSRIHGCELDGRGPSAFWRRQHVVGAFVELDETIVGFGKLDQLVSYGVGILWSCETEWKG